MNYACATIINSINHLKPWSMSAGSKTYPNNFNNFCDQNPIHAPIMPDSLNSTNESDFWPNSGEYSISSSTVDIKPENIDAADIDSKNLATFINNMMDRSEDTWSTTTTPDTITYSSSEDINSDDSHVAQKSAPILRDRLSKMADYRTNPAYWQDYQERHQTSQPSPIEPSLPGHFQQCSQLRQISQQSPQHSQFLQSPQYPHCQFQRHNQMQQYTQLPHYSRTSQFDQMHHHNQIQPQNQLQPQNQQEADHYGANTSYFVPMLPCYQAMHQQEVGLRMGRMVSPMVSASGPSPPVTMPVSSTTAASPPSQSMSAPPSRKNAVSRVKTNRSLPSNKDGDNTIYHKCPLCLRPFKNKSNIKTHIRTHTKEKPYVCQICNKAFCQKAHLRKHLFTHQRQKN